MPHAAPISAVVPARNEEANIARAVESLAAQPEVAEIIVVNDQSTDRTGAILNNLSARIPRLSIVQGEALPAGWTGKNFALSRGVAQAHGEWLLFTDADVEHLPGSASRALAEASQWGAALVSFSPEQETRSWWERALIPFIFCRLAAHFSYAHVSDPGCADAAANGQYLLIRRDVYDSIGGHKAVRGEVVEDVALARHVKRAGHRVFFAMGQGIARTRMYRSFGAMWEGWTKNLYPLIGARPGQALRESLLVIPWLPALLLAGGLVHRYFGYLGVALLILRHFVYGLELRRNRYSVSRIIYYLPAALSYSAALLFSAWRHSRGSVSWKGREVSVGVR